MASKIEKPQDIGERSFQLALSVLRFLKVIPQNVTNSVLIKQLIRSVTSVGANIEEARGGHTKSDFTHAMNIAKKEALETRYWLRMLSEINNSKIMENVLEENNQIIKILMAIVKSSNLRKFN